MTISIVTAVKRNWKCIRLVVLTAVLAIGAGCSGIHASRSVSPLDFILPGLMHNSPAQPGTGDPAAVSPPVLAKN
ncbi:MAG TPA: hypothetical protein VK530_17970 [Candidatus Acidoferrum sp.]|nr:hypothetical protein [Candidatus Acidoferrum sp.]